MAGLAARVRAVGYGGGYLVDGRGETLDDARPLASVDELRFRARGLGGMPRRELRAGGGSEGGGAAMDAEQSPGRSPLGAPGGGEGGDVDLPDDDSDAGEAAGGGASLLPLGAPCAAGGGVGGGVGGALPASGVVPAGAAGVGGSSSEAVAGESTIPQLAPVDLSQLIFLRCSGGGDCGLFAYQKNDPRQKHDDRHSAHGLRTRLVEAFRRRRSEGPVVVQGVSYESWEALILDCAASIEGLRVDFDAYLVHISPPSRAAAHGNDIGDAEWAMLALLDSKYILTVDTKGVPLNAYGDPAHERIVIQHEGAHYDRWVPKAVAEQGAVGEAQAAGAIAAVEEAGEEAAQEASAEEDGDEPRMEEAQLDEALVDESTGLVPLREVDRSALALGAVYDAHLATLARWNGRRGAALVRCGTVTIADAVALFGDLFPDFDAAELSNAELRGVYCSTELVAAVAYRVLGAVAFVVRLAVHAGTAAPASFGREADGAPWGAHEGRGPGRGLGRFLLLRYVLPAAGEAVELYTNAQSEAYYTQKLRFQRVAALACGVAGEGTPLRLAVAAERAAAAEAPATAARSSGSGARGANASAVAAPTAAFGSTGGGGAVGAPAPHAPLALERTSGSVLSVTWPRMGRTYRGEVVGTAVKHGVEGVVVYYECDGKESWHDFGELDGGCTFAVLEPPVHMLDQIRRTSDDRLEGILPSPNDGRIYQLTSVDVEAHFSDSEINERAWLDGLARGAPFQHVPAAGKKKKVGRKAKPSAPAKLPDCVPSSLAKAFAHAGDREAAVVVATLTEVIIEAEGRKGDRLKCAAIDVVGRLCHYDAPKLKVTCALEVDPTFVALLLLKSSDGTMRTHAVATHGGCLLDSNEPAPLPLTRESLTRALGAVYGGVVRGYYFVPQPKASRRLGDSKRAREPSCADRWVQEPIAKKTHACSLSVEQAPTPPCSPPPPALLSMQREEVLPRVEPSEGGLAPCGMSMSGALAMAQTVLTAASDALCGQHPRRTVSSQHVSPPPSPSSQQQAADGPRDESAANLHGLETEIAGMAIVDGTEVTERLVAECPELADLDVGLYCIQPEQPVSAPFRAQMLQDCRSP